MHLVDREVGVAVEEGRDGVAGGDPLVAVADVDGDATGRRSRGVTKARGQEVWS